MKKTASISCFLAGILLAACNSEDKDLFSRQLSIDSLPQGATVVVNGFKLGKTPLEIGVETTDSGCFVRKTTITIIPSNEKHFTQIETFPAFRKSDPAPSRVPEKMLFDLSKNPETEKSLTVEY